MTANPDALLTTLEQKVDPAHAALVVVDVQNDFLAEGGHYHRAGNDVAAVRAAIAALPDLIEQARQAGVLVVFVQAIYDPPYLSGPMRDRNRRRGVEAPRCISGTWGAEFCGVQPRPGEPVVVKHRYSAFAGTTLDALLKERGIRSLLLVGVATEVCVESTARDGYFLDYYITMVADCCGTGQRADQEGALRRCERDFGIVATAAEIARAWQRLGANAAATAVRADA
jgi:ureidoacrylate peracid hydrolase